MSRSKQLSLPSQRTYSREILGGSIYVPWSTVQSWECIACGWCCRRFKVPLRPVEYAKLSEFFGSAVIELKSFGKVYLLRRGNTCIFLQGTFCALQPLDIKPLACKIFPFNVRPEPAGTKVQHSTFFYKGQRYSVYVNRQCKGLQFGIPTRAFRDLVIPEAIELFLNPQKLHRLLTSSFLHRSPLVRFTLRNIRKK